MKKLITLLMAAMTVFAVTSCDNVPAEGSSSTGALSSDTSSVVSFEAPEKIEHDGTNPGNYGGSTVDVGISVTELQSSLDNYKCEAQWITDDVFVIFYIHNVEVMPNYFEPRLIVDVRDPMISSMRLPRELSGYAIGGKAYKGGFVAAFKESVEVYDRLYNKIATYSAESVTAFDVSDNGDVVYVDQGKVMLNGNDAGCGLTDATSCAISSDGTMIAAGNQTKGVFINNGSKTELDLTGLDKRYEILFSDSAVYFAGRPRAGVKLTAEKVTFDGTSSTISYGELFENTYARGSIIECNGKIYLISALTPSANDFGNCEIVSLDGDLKPAGDAITLDGGYHSYHRYHFSPSGKLIFTENLAGEDVKDYVHIIE